MKIKQILGNILYTSEEKTFINYLKPLRGKEWDGKLPDKKWGSQTKRDTLKKEIKKSLDELQGEVCCFCGLFLYETSGAAIEHIAPKGQYPEFTFTETNMALSCTLCNGFEKKGVLNTIDVYNSDYNLCTFNIVHPYKDDPNDHYSFESYDKGELILNFKTSQALKSRDIFDLAGVRQAEARGRMFMHQELKSSNELEILLKEILKNKYTSI